MQTLGGTKQYLAGYLALRQHKAAEKVREAARKEKVRQDAEQQAYDRFRRSQAADIFASLPDAEREAIEAQARAHAAKFTGFLRQTMFEFGKVRFTIERHGDKLTAFDDWKADTARI